MKTIFTLLYLTLFYHLSFAGTDWNKKLRTFQPMKFQVAKEHVSGITLEEAKTAFKKDIREFYSKLDDQYKSQMKVDYSPFNGRWLLGSWDMVLGGITANEQLLTPEFEKTINDKILKDYQDFYESEFVISNHKVFDHEIEIYNLKKELISVSQQLEVLKATAKEDKPESIPQESRSINVLQMGVLLLISAVISFLIKKAPFLK